MVKYEESIIYKLCCKDTDITEIYIGSTCNFSRRKSAHKSNCNNINSRNCNLNVYKFIRNNGGFENWDMICVEQYEATDKRDLEMRERYWIDTLNSKLNCNRPCVSIEEIKETQAQYYSENKDKIKETQARYSSENKDKIKETHAQYYSENKDKIKEYSSQYRSENKDKIKEYSSQYRSENKDKIKEDTAQKVICECGSEIRKDGLSKHTKTKKHIQYTGTL